MLWHQWDYLYSELKTTDGRSYDWSKLDELGNEGWELAAFVPLPNPDPEGVFDTTIGYLLFKRPRAS